MPSQEGSVSCVYVAPGLAAVVLAGFSPGLLHFVGQEALELLVDITGELEGVGIFKHGF